MSDSRAALPTLMLFVIVLLSCGNETPAVKTDSVPQVDSTAAMIIDTIRNSGICLNIPRNMVPVFNLNPDAFLQFSDSQNEEYLIIIRENKKAFADSIRSMPGYDANDKPVENYCHYWRATMIGNLDSVWNMAEIHRVGARSFMQQLDFVAHVDGVPEPIAYKMGFVEGKEYMYVLTAWTLLSHQKENDPMYERIHGSFIEE